MAPALCNLTLRDQEGRTQTLKVTEEHPLHLQFGGWIPAKSLSAGDTILGAQGMLEVVANTLEARPDGVTVYNLEVEEAHTYFALAEQAPAGAKAAWAHNATKYGALSNFSPEHFIEMGDCVDGRLPTRVEGGTTHGLVELGGEVVFLKSGMRGPGSRWYDPAKPAILQACAHVEGHAAGMMLEAGLAELTVTINNHNGPCGNCLKQLPELIPAGSRLTVRWADDYGEVCTHTIEGK